ncbi:hypothetical protein IQ279_27155 [Streptomyces verrucosisporus]|uniref:hypothetical protein n=1 Tax=Streptomyces verrucosisporus TaxID=1695161 RepID=UPI0019D0A24E|nr:hypothetical protein [Streptomyces verrucosisporus]MBN3933237.1 hypothetical protein [Streptomyces verrucosisporus]
MPTPYGSRGAMVLGPDELRVLRSALALVLRPDRAQPSARAGGWCPEGAAEERAEAVRACLWLADALDEASREADRLRAFLSADLDRYRAALPGSAPGYLARLEEAVALGCALSAEDLRALRGLCAGGAGGAEAGRGAALLRRRARPTAPSEPSRAPGPPGRGRPAAVPRPVPTPAEVFPPRGPSPAYRQALPV